MALLTSLNTRTILIIDDEPCIREVYNEYLNLNYKNIETLLTDNGDDAWELIKRYNYNLDLVISDINHPGLNGIDLLKRTKTKYPLINYLIQTAYGSDWATNECRKYTNHFLRKPIRFGEFKKIIDQILVP